MISDLYFFFVAIEFLAKHHGLYVVRRFGRISFLPHNSSLEGGYEADICIILLLLTCPSIDILFCRIQNFQFLAENHSKAF